MIDYNSFYYISSVLWFFAIIFLLLSFKKSNKFLSLGLVFNVLAILVISGFIVLLCGGSTETKQKPRNNANKTPIESPRKKKSVTSAKKIEKVNKKVQKQNIKKQSTTNIAPNKFTVIEVLFI